VYISLSELLRNTKVKKKVANKLININTHGTLHNLAYVLYMKVIIILLYDALINYHGQPLNESNAKLATHFINSSIISANFFGSLEIQNLKMHYIYKPERMASLALLKNIEALLTCDL
jgi:hypothetical protein